MGQCVGRVGELLETRVISKYNDFTTPVFDRLRYVPDHHVHEFKVHYVVQKRLATQSPPLQVITSQDLVTQHLKLVPGTYVPVLHRLPISKLLHFPYFPLGTLGTASYLPAPLLKLARSESPL